MCLPYLKFSDLLSETRLFFYLVLSQLNAVCCESSAGCFKASPANNVDPDQTAPLGAVWSGSTLFCLYAEIRPCRKYLHAADNYSRQHFQMHFCSKWVCEFVFNVPSTANGSKSDSTDWRSLKNSEYDQEIPQSQTRGIVRKSHKTITRHQEDKQSKATSSLFPIEMIATLVWTQSNESQK